MAIETHIHAFPRHVASKTYPEAVAVYDSTNKRIRVGDGSTVGGTEVPNMTDLNGKAAASDVTALAGRMTAAETAISGKASASDLAGKAAASDVTSLAGRVSDLETAVGTFETQARAILGEEETAEEEEEEEE